MWPDGLFHAAHAQVLLVTKPSRIERERSEHRRFQGRGERASAQRCIIASCKRAAPAHHAGLSRTRASGHGVFTTVPGHNQKLHGRHARRSYRQPRIRIAFQDAWRETASAGGRWTGGSFRTDSQWLISRLTHMTCRTSTYSHTNGQITILPHQIRRAAILSSHPNATPVDVLAPVLATSQYKC